MKVLNALLDAVSGQSAAVRAVHVGAFQTAVTADSTGLASTCRPEHSCLPQSEQGVADAGSLVGRDLIANPSPAPWLLPPVTRNSAGHGSAIDGGFPC